MRCRPMSIHFSPPTALVFVAALLLAACGAPAASPAPSSTEPPSPAPVPAGLYLRAWQTQALPPPTTFSWLPLITVADDLLIDGNVAVPAIYPGPLLIVPFARAISDAGQAALLEEAQRLGLLGEETDLTGGSPPGMAIGHIEIVVDGRSREILGDPSRPVSCDGARCDAEPGTPEAFAAFWQELHNLDALMPAELGQVGTYEPDRVAVLTVAPEEQPDVQPQVQEWPLDVPLNDFGQPYTSDPQMRCAVVEGDDLDELLPALLEGNQLTVFVDAQENARSIVARVMVPGEPSPCG